jgi:hypothetical protein
MVTEVRYPAAPAVKPLVSRLLDVAEDVPNSAGFGWLTVAGVPWFESFNALQFRHAAALCAPNTKTFDQSTVWTYPFVVTAYGGVQCESVGGLGHQAQIEKAFTTGESVAVEAGGAVKPLVGLALLEGWMGTHYIGEPVIHTPTAIASLLAGPKYIEPQAGTLYTPLGSVVVNGAGYDIANASPSGVAAPAGEKWLYATGTVMVHKGDLVAPDTQLNRSDNRVYTLVERPYVVAVDGPVAAIRVQVST